PLPRAGVVLAGLEPQGALTDGGQGDLERQAFADPAAVAEALQARRRQDEGVVLAGVELLQARVHVPAKGGDLQVGPTVEELTDAAQGRRPHPRALRQVVEPALRR